MARAMMCRDMQWDYYTYEAQPPFFLEELRILLSVEAARAKNQQKELEAKQEPLPSKGYSRHG